MKSTPIHDSLIARQHRHHGPPASHSARPSRRSATWTGIRAETDRLLAEFNELSPSDPRRNDVGDQIVRLHLNLIHSQALRLARRREFVPDLIQVGSIGLMKAIDRFDPDRNVEFSTFAIPNVVGEMRRYFRDFGWALRVPRRAKELQPRVERAESELTQALRREPTADEIAERLGVPGDHVHEAMEVAANHDTISTSSSSDVDGDDRESGAMSRALSRDEVGFDVAELRATLWPCLLRLPTVERRVIVLRFFSDETQTQIAQQLGVSQMQVSRLAARALQRLRRDLLPAGA